MNNNIDFSIYKNRLVEYLNMKGIQCRENSNVRCFIPGHFEAIGKHDDNFSCTVNSDYVFCHACKKSGDIYDAVEWFEGITDKKEQFEHLRGVFGGAIAVSQIEQQEGNKKRREKWHLKDDALEKIRIYMSDNPRIEEITRTFFAQREKIKGGKYPKEIVDKLLHSFLYWPGIDIARHDFSFSFLYEDAGIPYKVWQHSGLVIPLARGFKLHYCTDKECKKYNSGGAKAFPVPTQIDASKPVIIVEGELDSLVARAAGVENVYSAGSVSGVTEEVIKKYLLSAKEIILMFDNDPAGRKEMGVEPKISEKGNQLSITPEKLRKYGYTGLIKIALLEQYKDADECVRNNRADLIFKAIKEACKYQAQVKNSTNTSKRKKTSTKSPARPATAEAPALSTRGTMTEKELKSILRQEKIQLSCLEKKDVQPFISACMNAVVECTDDTKKLLESWGAPVGMLKKAGDIKPSFLVHIAEKYGLTYYFINKIRHATLTPEELKQLAASPDTPIITIDFSKVQKNKDFLNFIKKHGNKSAANLCAFVLGDRLAYAEKGNCFYRFNGHVWEREPDPWGVVYNILATILNYFIRNNNEGTFKSDDLFDALVAIERRSFRNDVVKDLSVLPTVWHEKIQFDGVAIKETLTLLDGVIDFTGQNDKKLHFRTSMPKEFRMKMLPYKIDDVRNAGTPEEFFKFMHGNFKNDDTLEMLNQFISLIPSRCAKYKVAGIFVGKSHTGKTTTINLLQDIYKYHQNENSATTGEKENMLVPLPAEKIMLRGRYGHASNGPDPFIAQLIGAGAAVCDETDKNDKIDSAIFKAYTGGGMLTVRNMFEKPQNYEPTAQIIISTNYSPKFDSSDQAVINRMVVVPFSIVHEPDSTETKSEDYFVNKIRPEYPAIIKYYAELYLKLKYEMHGKIKISKEAEKYKGDYVQNQATDLSRFVDTCIEFVKDDSKFVRLKDVYAAYIQFSGGELDENGKPKDKDGWTQSKFTRYFKGDYNEVIISQKKYPGHTVPEQIVLNCVLKAVPVEKGQTGFQSTPVSYSDSKQKPEELFDNNSDSQDEENPFDDYDPKFDIY